jgi:hypothetical protein
MRCRRKRFAVAALAAFVIALLVLPSTGAGRGERRLRATLSGAPVVPPPGDPDGRGTARLALRGTKVCWRLVVRGIQRPHAAHVHFAPRGMEGPAVVPLFLTPRSLARPKRGCVTARRVEVRDIARRPRRYYVNVHNDEYPNGAVRGQLSRIR